MQMNNDLEFDSFFESGNLDMVVKVSEAEYDLYMRVDSNTQGHNQWFYFKVKNKSSITVKFNVLNFTKRESLYKYGMRVSVYSELENSYTHKGWQKSGDKIAYKSSKISKEIKKEIGKQ